MKKLFHVVQNFRLIFFVGDVNENFSWKLIIKKSFEKADFLNFDKVLKKTSKISLQVFRKRQRSFFQGFQSCFEVFSTYIPSRTIYFQTHSSRAWKYTNCSCFFSKKVVATLHSKQKQFPGCFPERRCS